MTDTPRPTGDMDPEAFRREGHRIVDWLADYLAAPERYPVLSRVSPGDVSGALPARAPERGESFDDIFADFERVIVPGLTHWNHPGFFAYFDTSASGPGILAEMLSAGLNQQAMLWRTSPAATELEEVALGWLRDLMGLPASFEGVIYDTASVTTLHALAAAREDVAPDIRMRGMCGRTDLPQLRVYCSEHTHSSIDKAVILLGLGQDAIRRIPADEHFAMEADRLAEAIAEDRETGVVHPRVDPAERDHCLLGQRFHRPLVRHVGHDRQRLPSLGRDLVGRLLDVRCVARREHDTRPPPACLERRREPDPTGRARDDDDLFLDRFQSDGHASRLLGCLVKERRGVHLPRLDAHLIRVGSTFTPSSEYYLPSTTADPI